MRFLVRGDVARQLDDALAAGLGGFRNHHELANAALESYLLELMYPDDGLGTVAAERGPAAQGDIVVHRDSRSGPVDSLRLERVPLGAAVEDQLSSLADEPLLGLHNRDWPSLWALATLAQEATLGPVSLRRFLTDVTARAWHLADAIAAASPNGSQRATAMLPTNREKRQSAEGAFQTFAIASVGKRAGASGQVRVAGPLPAWRAIGLVADDAGDLQVGVAPAGWELLERMAGLTPWAPHAEKFTRAFFDHIGSHSPGEVWGFQRLVGSVREHPSRVELVARFAEGRPWKESIAASAAQGYLARGREWGLVEPKIIDGRYRLTDLGHQLADQLQSD